MHRHILLSGCAALVVAVSSAFAESGGQGRRQPDPAPIVIGASWTLSSAVLGDTRQVNVWTPAAQARDGRRYTVLYVLDGALDQDFQHVAGLAQLGDLSWTFEPVIVVGVQTRNRRAELTPPASDARYVSAFPEAGGAAAFRRFLETEVIPFVEARYPASGRRALAGESLAGLFVVDNLRIPTLRATLRRVRSAPGRSITSSNANPGRPSMRLKQMIRALLIGASLAGCEMQPGAGPSSKTTVDAPAGTRTVRSADGTEIAFAVAGAGQTALVFIHGWSCDSGYWDAQVPAFSNQYTTVAVDLAGHGRSGAERRRWSMAAYGQDVAAVVRSLPHRRIILIGHSMGGYAALGAARLLPERVIGVVGVDSLQDLDGQATDEAGAEMLLAGLRRQPMETTRGFVLETFFTERSDPALARRIADDMATAPPSVSVPSMEALMRYDPKPTASALRMPVVAIIGEMMPVDETAAKRLVPGFRARKISRAGHFFQIEEPDTFNAELRSELARIEAGRTSAGQTAAARQGSTFHPSPVTSPSPSMATP